MLHSKKSKAGEGSHKSRELAHTASRQKEVPDVMPRNLSFLWSIDAIELNYHENIKPRYKSAGGAKSNDVSSYWFPPNKKKHFIKSKGQLYLWEMGQSIKIQGDIASNKLDRYSVASVFFQERQDNFLVAGVDCATKDVKEEEVGWSQIRFNHKEGGLSEVLIAAAYDGLAAPALGSSWMPQVLPEVYDKRMKGPTKELTTYGGLCGSLSILIGIAAFSAPVENAEEAVSQSFGLREWKQHSFAERGCRYQDRGVVATIYLDPNAKGITKETLNAFENGKYGPIFAATQTHTPSAYPPLAGGNLSHRFNIPRSSQLHSLRYSNPNENDNFTRNYSLSSSGTSRPSSSHLAQMTTGPGSSTYRASYPPLANDVHSQERREEGDEPKYDDP